MSIEKPRKPRKSKNLNVNDDNRLLLFADELKKQYPISNNIYFSLLTEIRNSEKIVDLYPTIAKLDKQLSFADKSGYSHAILIGENELSTGEVQIKNLIERSQRIVKIENTIEGLKE